MKIDKKYQLDKCVSNDELRPEINQVYYDGERLFSTDGHRLAVIVFADEDIDQKEKPGYVPPEIFIESRKLKHNEHIQIKETEIIVHKQNRKIIYLRQDAETEYPDVNSVIEKDTFENPIVKLTLNPVYLLELAEALGSQESVTLYISKKHLNTGGKAIGVRPFNPDLNSVIDELFGLLMPLKGGE